MWLVFAFSGPMLWALSTHIDKYLVEKYFKDAPTAVLMVFTAILGAVMLPFIWYFDPNAVSIGWVPALVMAASGCMYMGAMLFYLQAIQSEEASVVAPLFQASVLWGAALAYILLGERLTGPQLLGGALIVAGALMVSVGGFNRRHLKARLVALMLAATFVLALSSVVFKLFAIEDASYWSTTFWTFVGEAIFGVGLLCVPAYLKQFAELIKTNTGPLVSVNAANELINLGGGLGVRFALLPAPLALVQAISSTTTLFVFFFGIGLTYFFPSLGRESISRRDLIQKGAAALLVAAGVALIGQW